MHAGRRYESRRITASLTRGQQAGTAGEMLTLRASNSRGCHDSGRHGCPGGSAEAFQGCPQTQCPATAHSRVHADGPLWGVSGGMRAVAGRLARWPRHAHRTRPRPGGLGTCTQHRPDGSGTCAATSKILTCGCRRNHRISSWRVAESGPPAGARATGALPDVSYTVGGAPSSLTRGRSRMGAKTRDSTERRAPGASFSGGTCD